MPAALLEPLAAMEAAAAGGEPAVQAPAEQQQDQDERPITSRICVKNLPKYVDDRRLREHFEAKGEVTDAKIMRTKDGKSRCFGFVGFRTPEEAEAAVRYFNKSFMDTMRLAVEFAYKFGSGEGPRAWSKYTEGTSAHRRAAAPPKTGANDVPLGEGGRKEGKKKKKGRGEPLPEEADPKLREFLQVMQPRSRQAIWTNDDLLPPGAAAAAAARGVTDAQQRAQQATDAQLADGGGSDDEYEELPAAAGGAAAPTPSSSGSGSEGGGSSSGDDDEGGGAQGPDDGVVRNAAVSDLEYLKSRVKASFDDDDEGFAAAAAAAGVSPDSDAEGSEGSEEQEEEEGASDSGSDIEAEAAEAEAAGGQHAAQQTAAKPLRRQADGADAELDAIFEGAQGAHATSDSDADPCGNEDEEMSDVASDDDAAAEEGAGGERRQQAEAQAVEVTEAADEATIADTGRLFVRNLPYTATEADLAALFEAHGDVSEVHLVLDRTSKKSKGFALVQFADPQDAVQAHAELDGSIFQGRLIHILPGKRAPPPPAAKGAAEGEQGEEGGRRAATSSYKDRKEAELKAGAGNRSAWNTLFMRADTVAAAVAAHYGVSKAELLDSQAGDLAVRMALGETQVIAQTKRALAEAGADVAALEAAAAAGGKAAAGSRGVARSDRVLVVKNLPFSAAAEELEALFGEIGPLGRLVLPPTRTLALVEYLEAQDARRAFKALAYKRYQHVPLYLEWAPRSIFSGPPPPRAAAAAAASAQPGKAAAVAAAEKPGKAAGELVTGLAEAEGDEAESSSIFVKNLAWATTDAALLKHFDAAVSAAGGSVRSAKVARKKGPDGKPLSAGFGFVECSSEAAARAAVKALQGSSLDGHKLVLQLSLKKGGGAAREGGGKAASQKLPDTSKVVVRNVAFEATRRDIMGLFTPFGAVKSCRLPRKFDGTHRGFAFVDFATKQEARNALEAVQGTHLYGRRLVLEWAEEEGGLDELRAKTAAKYRGEAALEGAAAPEPEQQRPQKRRRK